MSNKPVAIESPVGDLEWVVFNGEGKENLNGVMQYVAGLVLDEEKAAPFRKLLDAYWEENKPKSIKEAKSMGYYEHKIPAVNADGSVVKDEDGKVVYVEDGKTLFTFKTNVNFADGSTKVVKIFNSKGAEVSLGNKKIGNGSRGRILGAYGIYEIKDKKKNTIGAGVTLFLNGIQLSKYVEYIGGIQASAMDDEEDSFEGIEGNAGGIPDESSPTASTDKPRL